LRRSLTLSFEKPEIRRDPGIPIRRYVNMSTTMTVTIIGSVLVLIIVGYIVSIYNALITARNDVQKAWKNIDVVLQQRHDEIMKLIDTCKAYMKHEWDLLNTLTELRTGYTMAKEIDDKVRIENEMGELIRKLGMVWEQYPDLKASQNFIQIQDRVSAVESKIADYRELFNDAVNIFNIKIERFPDLLMANAMHYQRHAFLDVPEEKKKDVRMDFGNLAT
jgi:LemA protein